MTRCLASAVLTISLLGTASPAPAEDVIDVGARRELFADRFLVDSLSGDATLRLHQPQPQEVVLVTDEPWEGNTCAYYTIFQDGDLYRMYYRGSHWDEVAKKATHKEVVCYAESTDGVNWKKPKLGLIEFEGSKENNIVWNAQGSHNFTAFKDENPNCPDESRYKALAGGRSGLFAIHSPDGIHWSLMTDEPVITKGAFDSQNLAFWDPHAEIYREYHREFRGVRDIMTGTSSDFLHWTEPEFLDYGDQPLEHLYTNAIRNYPRAPHLLIGFPTRYLPKEQSVEPTFMVSRDGQNFHRWTEPVIPQSAPEDRAGNRSNYMTWGLLSLPGADDEYSVYATEAYYTGPDSRVRRFTFRVDGFTSLFAPESGGALVTKPLSFDGNSLEVNYRATDGGSLKIEIQDTDGNPLDGYAADDCTPLTGDETAAIVKWSGGSDVTDLADEPVRLRFVCNNTDVYSFRFTE